MKRKMILLLAVLALAAGTLLAACSSIPCVGCGSTKGGGKTLEWFGQKGYVCPDCLDELPF